MVSAPRFVGLIGFFVRALAAPACYFTKTKTQRIFEKNIMKKDLKKIEKIEKNRHRAPPGNLYGQAAPVHSPPQPPS
jgi:hypothetical protein